MNFPPALTWLQLFASNATCVCDPTSPPAEWFAQMLAKFSPAQMPGAPRLLVAQGKTSAGGAELSNYDGVVAISSPGMTAQGLEAAGFAYVRRFAVMPSLTNARWFISLDSPAIAAAGFSLYTPARRSAHLKKAAARLAARMRLPIWYRDEIIVASRALPPMPQKLSELFPNQMIHLALSSGAPEPAINRKASAVVLGPGGKILAFVKIGGSDVSRRIVEHEGNILPALAAREALGQVVPRLLFGGEIDGRYLTVQTPLAGKPAPCRLTPAHRAFLKALRNGKTKPAAATQMVATLPARLSDLPMQKRQELGTILDRLMPTLQTLEVTSTVIHGDFAPWNLRIHEGRISAFDWEYGELDGLPLVDETHYLLQLGSQLHHWNIDQACACLSEIAASKPLGMIETQVSAIHAVYLIDSLVRLLNEGYDPEDEMLTWYRELLNRLMVKIPEAVAV